MPHRACYDQRQSTCLFVRPCDPCCHVITSTSTITTPHPAACPPAHLPCSTQGASTTTSAAPFSVAADLAAQISTLEVAAAEGQSFPGIFSQQVALGALSRRQIARRSLLVSNCGTGGRVLLVMY